MPALLKNFSLLLLFSITLQGLAKETNHYATLGATPSSSKADLKKAYRQLAVQWHPDKNPGDKKAEEKFKELGEAWEVLGNSEYRKRYDEFFQQYRRYPTTDEFNPINFARAEMDARREAEKSAPVATYTHTSTKASDPKVEDFLVITNNAQKAYSVLRGEQFWEAFTSNHEIIHKNFQSILNDPAIDINEKHRAFVGYIDGYFYQNIVSHREEIKASQLIQALKMMETSQGLVKSQLGEEHAKSQRSFITAAIDESLIAQAQNKDFKAELAEIFKKSHSGGFSAWLKSKFSNLPIDKDSMLKLMTESSHISSFLVDHFLEVEDHKHAEILLESITKELQKLKEKALLSGHGNSEKVKASSYLASLEKIVQSSGKLPKLSKKAKEFFLSTHYAELKEYLGESVPLRSDRLVEFQVYLQKNLDRLNQEDPSAYTDKKKGLVPFIQNAIRQHLAIQHDSKMDKYDRLQSTELFVQSLKLSVDMLVNKAPVDVVFDLSLQLTDELEKVKLEKSLGVNLHAYVAKKLAKERSGASAQEIAHFLNSKKSTEVQRGLDILKRLRPHNFDMSALVFNELMDTRSSERGFEHLLSLWGQDVAEGPKNIFYEQSRSLLNQSLETYKTQPRIADAAKKALISAQRDLSSLDKQHAAALKKEALSSMKSSGYGCVARLRARIKMK